MRLPVLLNGASLVTDSFIRRNPPAPNGEEQMSYVGDGTEPALRQIGVELGRMMTEQPHDRAKMDGKTAVLMHRLLALTRREAAEMRFWHYLAAVQFSEYVAWRYFDEAQDKVSRQRYLGSLSDNALSRLWWWAELTADRRAPDPYKNTIRGAESPEFVKGIVENLLGGNRLLVNALVDALFSDGEKPPENQVKDMMVRTNALLVTVAVDALDEPEIRSLIARVHATLPKE